MRRAAGLVVAALVAVGCDDLRTESRNFGLNFPDFVTLSGLPPYLALEGTRLCDENPRCGPCDLEPPTCESVDLTIEGASVDVDGCYPVELGAPLTYTFAPTGCTEAIDGESLVVEAISPDEVGARFDAPITLAEDADDDDRYAIASQGDPLPPASDLVPLQLLAGATAELGLRLREEATDRQVGWNPSAGLLKLQAIDGEVPTLDGDLESFTLSVAAGARTDASLAIAGVEYPLADVVGVGEDALDRVDLTALFLDSGADGQQPYRIEAHVRDAAGHLVMGVPISWTVVEGDLVLDPGDGPPGQVAGLSECIPRRPQSTRRGVVEAAHGELRARLEVAWKGYSGEEAYNAGPCEEGCGCRSGGRRGWASC
ncbi:MAG: Ig-like domain-containing protein [Nannocystaceae bacterium]